MSGVINSNWLMLLKNILITKIIQIIEARTLRRSRKLMSKIIETVQFEKEIDASFFFGTKQKPWQLIKPPNLEILLIPSCRVEE